MSTIDHRMLGQCRQIASEAAQRINGTIPTLNSEDEKKRLEGLQTMLMRIDWCLRFAAKG